MKKFEFLDHTADALFRAYGKNLEEQFTNAALATFSIITTPAKVAPKITKDVAVEGKDVQALLYNWIDELLYLMDADFFVLHAIKKITIAQDKKRKTWMLTAVVTGDSFTKKYETGEHVKAATYHEMTITKEYVQMVLDL